MPGPGEYADPASSPRYAETGPGSLATFGPRLGAFVVDGILADLLAIVVNGGYHVGGRQNLTSYLAFLAIEIVFVTLGGQTPGMRVAGVAVVNARTHGRVAIGWVLVRTVLLATIIVALIPDGSGRILHDRAAGTLTIRTR